MSGCATRSTGMGRTLVRLFALLSGAVAAAGLSFAIQFVLSRNLDVAGYGRVVALLAVTNILAPLASWGAAWMWIELYGREGWHARRWVSVSTRMMALSSLAAILLTVVYVVATLPGTPWHCISMVLAASLIMLGQSQIEIVTARLQLEERYNMLAAWQLFNPGARVVSVVVALAAGFRDPSSILAAFAVIGVATGLIGLATVKHMRQGRICLAGHGAEPVGPASLGPPSLRHVFHQALPYVLQSVVFLIASQGIVAIVDHLLGPHDAGIYGVAFVLMSAMYLAPTVIYTKYLGSKVFRWWVHERAMFNAAFHLGASAQLVLGLVSMAIMMGAAPFLVTTLFGERYNDAIPIVRILALSLPVRFVLYSMASTFYSKEHIMRKVTFAATSTVATVGLVFALAPVFGLAGAAVAVVLGDSFLLLLFGWGTYRYIDGIVPWSPLRPSILKKSLDYVSAGRGGSA